MSLALPTDKVFDHPDGLLDLVIIVDDAFLGPDPQGASGDQFD